MNTLYSKVSYKTTKITDIIFNLVFSTRFIKMEYQVFHLLYIAVTCKESILRMHSNRTTIISNWYTKEKNLIYDICLGDLFKWNFDIWTLIYFNNLVYQWKSLRPKKKDIINIVLS